ncbi:ATP phosphoribosyltransferase [Paracrocinitomix mangrovi]|uniref:ATP phosphoribosyltransferase n=1 Tax=Paracrocinitomix mangrovi TaxID=2862509 RepID=UPI001C8DF6AC|nr:ATP phosphoribosyltransferase [Paracrocinitomix mangrovi]UKN02290.1 ATP phosphoribosyltransferase [Paracrocinitomix mangrovi]
MSKLKIAIQKSGRLKDDSLALLKQCGISVDNGRDQLKVSANNFPLEIFFLRNSDIPQYIEDGVVDLGIVGENLLYEIDSELDVLRSLNFSKCRVSIAVPKNSKFTDIKDFEGKKIATSYPNTTQKFFKSNGVNTEVHAISGSVEIAPNIGLSDAICDIVSTGNTLFNNGLKELFVIMKSQAVLVKQPKPSREVNSLIEQLNFRIGAVLRAKTSKYILMNVPNANIQKVSALLPVLKSPTVLPLAEEGWSSLHSVIDEDDFWNVIDQLKEAGAEGILVAPIEKIIE